MYEQDVTKDNSDQFLSISYLDICFYLLAMHCPAVPFQRTQITFGRGKGFVLLSKELVHRTTPGNGTVIWKFVVLGDTRV